MNDPSLSPPPGELAAQLSRIAASDCNRGRSAIPLVMKHDEVRVCAAALRAVRGVPEGWRLVPIDGTDAMVSAWCAAGLSFSGPRQTQGEVRAMFRHSLTAAIEAAPAPPLWPEAGSDRVRHLKRGTVYTVACRTGEVQSGHPIHEGDMLATYIGADGKVWHRPIDEFEDGRFEAIDAPAAPGTAPIVIALSVPAVRALMAMIRVEAKATTDMLRTDAPAAAIDARARALDELTRAVLAGVVDRLPAQS